MRLTVSQERLSYGLQHLLKAVSANHPLPILTGVKLVAERAVGLHITSSNLSLSVEYAILPDDDALSMTQGGSIVVNARFFYDIVRKLPPGTVSLEIKDQMMLTIHSAKSLFRLSGIDAEQFPVVPTPKETHATVRVPNRVLKTAIRQVTFAAATAEDRPVLTGVSLGLTGNFLNMTATDGIRFASRTVLIQKSNTADLSNVVVPRRNLVELSKILTDDESATVVTFGNNQIHFSMKHCVVHSALVEGTYPQVSRLIPTSYPTEMIVDTTDFLRALERVSLFARADVVRLSVGLNHWMELKSRTEDVGDVIEEVRMEDVVGEAITISFNVKYMIDIVRHIDCTKMKVKFSGMLGPIVLQPNVPQETATYVVTPVRTSDS